MPRRDPNPDTNGHTDGNDSAPDAHGYSNGNDSAADAYSNGYSDGDRHGGTAASADSRAQRDAARHAAAAALGEGPNQSSLQALAKFASACSFSENGQHPTSNIQRRMQRGSALGVRRSMLTAHAVTALSEFRLQAALDDWQFRTA
jgi:hypothetical protein